MTDFENRLPGLYPNGTGHAPAGSPPRTGGYPPPERTPARRPAPPAPTATEPPATPGSGAEPPAAPPPGGAPADRAPVEPPAAGPDAHGPVTAGSVTAEPAEPDVWDRRVADGLAFLRRRITGSYEVDEFGFDRELTDGVFYPLLRPLYRDWFRIEVEGAENLPADGSALVVANHSGVVALDALMLSVAVHDEHPGSRYLRLLGADLVFRVPFISELARKHGSTLACAPDAERLLRRGELVGVFPEGFKGVGKPYRDRYKLQRFGRGGFVSAALRTGTPIIPVSIVGAEETYPMLGNIKPLARLLGIPYFPVTPTFPWLGPLGLIPLPSKWLISFGTPIETSGRADQADDPALVFNLADQVRESIQQTLYRLLERRDQA